MQDNTTKTNKKSIVCRVKKVVFHNKENGYSVLSVISDAEDTPFSICGILNGNPEGDKYYKDHPNALLDVMVDDMGCDLESALETALKDAGIEYEDCEYQCTRLFSRHKISGDIF